MILFNNFLETNLYNSLENIFLSNTNLKKNFKEIVFRKHINSDILYDIIKVDNKFISNFEKELIYKINYKFKSIQIQFCLWENNSYLNMHYDSIYKYGATLYLNDWKDEWGGLFVYKTHSGIEKKICPKKNLLVFSDKSEIHGVTLINSPEKRKTVQIWFN